MECKTVKLVKKNGEAVITKKVKYPNYFVAEEHANEINALKKVKTKRVAYHCSECGFYHVGTSLEMLKNKPKEKPKFIGGRFGTPKVVGQVDLSQFNNPQPKKIKYMSSVYVFRKIYHYQIKTKIVEVVCPDGSKKRPKITKIQGCQKTLKQRRIIDYIAKNIAKK